MTGYATPDQLRVALTRDPQHPEGTAAELSDAALQQSIDAAQSQIDISLGGRYTVPFDPVPSVIGPIAVAIAAWIADLGYRQSVDSSAGDPVAARHQWALTLLGKLAGGTGVIPAQASDTAMFDVNPYTGVLFGPNDFDLDTSGRRRRFRDLYSDSPDGAWSGAWDD